MSADVRRVSREQWAASRSDATTLANQFRQVGTNEEAEVDSPRQCSIALDLISRDFARGIEVVLRIEIRAHRNH
jgi:hypothetical protein